MNQGQVCSSMPGMFVLAPVLNNSRTKQCPTITSCGLEDSALGANQNAVVADNSSLVPSQGNNGILHCITPLAMQIQREYAKSLQANSMTSPRGVDQLSSFPCVTTNVHRPSFYQVTDFSNTQCLHDLNNVCPINLLQEIDSMRRIAAVRNDVASISHELTRRIPIDLASNEVTCLYKENRQSVALNEGVSLGTHLVSFQNDPLRFTLPDQQGLIQPLCKTRRLSSCEDGFSGKGKKRRKIHTMKPDSQGSRSDVQDVRFFNEGVEVNAYGRPL